MQIIAVVLALAIFVGLPLFMSLRILTVIAADLQKFRNVLGECQDRIEKLEQR